jgi:uncharacterized protein (UPF0332 family)
MSLHDDLIAQASRLARSEPRRPKQASLRRAVSTAYYALFHLLISEGSAVMSPMSDAKLRVIVARAFQHGAMKSVASDVIKGKFSKGYSDLGLSPSPTLKSIGSTFCNLQEKRHEADYDIGASFTRDEVLKLVEQSERAFTDWRQIRRTKEAMVFLQSMLLKGRD